MSIKREAQFLTNMILKISGVGGGGGKKNSFATFFYVLFKMNLMYFLFHIIYDKTSTTLGPTPGENSRICA